MNDAKDIRAFLALDPPEDTLLRIGDLQDRMKRMIRGEVRWVKSGGVHLTLKFFSDISERDVSTISGAVVPIAAHEKPLSLEIRTAGLFPDVRRPRVLWLGMGGEVSRLTALQQKIDHTLAGCGFEKEERAFRPHLTLARIKSPLGLTGIDEMLASRDDFDAGPFTPAGLTLFRSELTPKGARYSQLAHFPFQEAAP